jgi:two-component system, chemotaxis family, CheB/CheR fusion protein
MVIESLPNEQPHFPIVGIGASAGGLAAFEHFFSGILRKQDIGMAFILVQHLAPDHKSLLPDLIKHFTSLPVFLVEDGMYVRPNSVYINPPNSSMALFGGCLQLMEPAEPRGLRLPIDFFFNSLAHEQKDRAIGIVLSGAGSDGTAGIHAIKEVGGVVLAQEPGSAEFQSMPTSAIETGLVDFVLAPDKMAEKILSYTTQVSHQPISPLALAGQNTDLAMNKIFTLIRLKTGHDFSKYKPSTLYRRVERRMAVHEIIKLGDYLKFLQQSPNEVEALFYDLLIGVTHFFRDVEVFNALEQEIIPSLFSGKPTGSIIRIWSAGCSTGEEAYSLAILMQEHIEALRQSFTIQIFATDLDPRSINTARSGIFSSNTMTDISPERLTRFFTLVPNQGKYRITKNIRDMMIFSPHSLIKDPPFSKIDLLSCRNLLIYLSAELQKKLIPILHYALKPGGYLMLGNSEGIGDFEDHFTVIDRKNKLYQRKQIPVSSITKLSIGFTIPQETNKPDSTHIPTTIFENKPTKKGKRTLRNLTEQTLLQHYAPASALVNAQGDIFYLHGRTGMYLEPVAGEASPNNILKMAREGLYSTLAATLHQVATTQILTSVPNVRVKTNGHFTLVNIKIIPLAMNLATELEPKFYLVSLEESKGNPVAQDETTSTFRNSENVALNSTLDPTARIASLEQQIQAKDEYIQATHEELESSNEELKSSNEEMQSVNEELQSTNEELETSKEELQSVNEELATVNAELQAKVQNLSEVNGDMNNLLAGTGIATLFVDHQLQIMRFTPSASDIINVIKSDEGRPIAHLMTNILNYPDFIIDIQSVLDTLVPKERDVETKEGRWYRMRMQPYRTLDNVIRGAVISFIDISVQKKVEVDLAKATDMLRLAIVVRDAHDAITVQDLEGRILAWNPGATRIYGWSEDEALKMHVQDRIPVNQRQEAIKKLLQLSQGEILESYRANRLTKTGKTIPVSIISTALLNMEKHIYAIATTERAIENENSTLDSIHA